MRTREEQIDSLYYGHNRYSTITQDAFRNHLEEAERRAEQRVRAEIVRAVDKACETVMSLQTPAMGGDNLAVTLCSHFEDCEGEEDDNGWHPKAVEGCDQISSAIAKHFRSAIDAALAPSRSGEEA